MFERSDAPGENMAHRIHLWDIRDDGVMVVSSGKAHGHKKSLVVMARLKEPDTRLLNNEERYYRHILPIEQYMRSEEAIGLGQQLQILRHIRPQKNFSVLEESLGQQSLTGLAFPHATSALAANALEGFLRSRTRGMVEIRTYLFLSLNLDKARLGAEELAKQMSILLKRLRSLAEPFAKARYGFEIESDRRELMRVFDEYFNPETAKHVEPPLPKYELRRGQLTDFNLLRHPELAVASLRRQLVRSPIEFRNSYAFGDGVYRAFLSLTELPEYAITGFSPVFCLDRDLIISQYWWCVGKRKIGAELERSQAWIKELIEGFGKSPANSGLMKNFEGVQELREELGSEQNVVKYAMRVQVLAGSLEELDEAVREVQSAGDAIAGAVFYREYMPERLKKCFIECAPAVPQHLVRYNDGRGHILSARGACWFLPRYGTPGSDPYTETVPYTLAFAPDGNLVRKADWGFTTGALEVIFGPPGSGKSVNLKLKIQQDLCQPGVYIWTLDYNNAETSYDFQAIFNGGRNIRFSDKNPVCLRTFDIVGERPSINEAKQIVSQIWYDIHLGIAPLPGDIKTILRKAVYDAFKRSNRPGYEELIDSLIEAQQGNPYYAERIAGWILSLQAFCSGEYLTRLNKSTEPMPDGEYYAFYGRRDGIGVRDLLDYRMVTWNLADLGEDYLREKTATLIQKLSRSFAFLLRQKSKESGREFYLNFMVDEGWKPLVMDGGEFLNEAARKHRHWKLRLRFASQYISDIESEEGKVLAKSANHWIVVGANGQGEEEREALGFTDTEAKACTQLANRPGIWGEFVYRRKRKDGTIESHRLVNAVPHYHDGRRYYSWWPLVAGDTDNCGLREQLLRVLGADSTEVATREQCELVFQVMGAVWPTGLPVGSHEKEKYTREEGWPIAMQLIDEHKRRQAVQQQIREFSKGGNK
jgi:hypothetical protein